MWSPLDCRSCRSLASWASASAASRAASLAPAILARAVDRQTNIHVVRHIRTPVLAWMVAAGAAWGCAQGPGPLVMRAVLSICVAVGLYLGLLFLTRRELMLTLAREYWPWIRRLVLRRKTAPVTISAQA